MSTSTSAQSKSVSTVREDSNRSTSNTNTTSMSDIFEEPASTITADHTADYWLGKRFVDLVIGEQTIRRHQGLNTSDELDATADVLCNAVSFEDEYIAIQPHLSFTVSTNLFNSCRTPRQAFCILAGLIRRKGVSQDKRYLTKAIRQITEEVPNRGMHQPQHNANSDPNFHRYSGSHFRALGSEGSQSDSDTNRLPLYSMALKEYGDIIGSTPRYIAAQLNLDPPLWKINLEYCGKNFVGTGKTKKSAQHEAARKACLALNVSLSDQR